MTKPTTAVLNAIAAIELTGDTLPHTSTNTRLALWDYATYVSASTDELLAAIYAGKPLPMRKLNDEGRALLETAPLWKCAQYLIERGWKFNKGRRSKPGFVLFTRFNEEKGRMEDAFISSGRRVYEPVDGSYLSTNTFSA